MKVIVKVKPYSKLEGVKELLGGNLSVNVNEPAEGGKANHRAIELLAEHYSVSKSCIRIISGHTGRLKLVEIKK